MAYEGIVTAGINFENIDIKMDEENKKTIITLPPAEIQGVRLKEESTMDYIFTKSKYETETVIQEATKIAREDLQERASKEHDIKNLAADNAKRAIEALIKPWVRQLDAEYSVVIE